MLEKELIKKCRLNDDSAFEVLIQNYRKQLFSYLLRLSGNRMMAEDLLQETLIKVWKGIKFYNDQNKFSSWLFSIAHNTAIDSIRSASVRNRTSLLEDINEISGESNPYRSFVEKETYEMVMLAINELSEDQKNVFLLRQHSGMKFKEIAKTMDQPLNTVLGHMHYAVSKIRKKLGKEYG